MGTDPGKHRTKGSIAFRREIGAEHGSQAAAAQRLGTQPDVISRIVSEQRRCSLELALRIEQEYGIAAALWTQKADGEAAA
jgi:plasmid maintenance system antidote protein VapI